VSVFEDGFSLSNGASGDWLLAPDTIENFVGTKYDDGFGDVGIAHGGAGNDYLNGSGYGDSGNDHLAPTGPKDVWGGSGNDTFEIFFGSFALGGQAPDSDGSIIHDFVHGVDHIELNGDPNSGAFLTHLNDVYTIHYFDADLGHPNTTEFEVVGSTHLDTS